MTTPAGSPPPPPLLWREVGFEGEKSSATQWGNSLESQQWSKVGIVEAPPLSVLLGWVDGRGEDRHTAA